MSRLRVLRVIARMNVGGPALQVVGITDGLDQERFEQRLLVGSVGPDEADYLALRAPHIDAVSIPGLGRDPDATGDVRAVLRLLREVRRFRPHIVHTHTAKAGALGRIAGRLGGAPVLVHTFHGHLLHGYFSPAVTRAVVLAERTLARTTARLLAVGTQVRDELLAAGIGRPAQYRVVPPGVSLPAPPTDGAARESLGLPSDAPVVALVARLTAVKRPDRFADVARRVHAVRPDVRFLVTGEGPLLDELRSAMAPLGDAIRFAGWRGDVETVYAASDIVLLTSDNEGMPLSLIEAAMAGRPAVATDVGSVAEVVRHGETGILVPPDPVALAAAVVELLGDDDRRRRLGAAASAWAGLTFGTERLVADTSAIYEELAEERGLR